MGFDHVSERSIKARNCALKETKHRNSTIIYEVGSNKADAESGRIINDGDIGVAQDSRNGTKIQRSRLESEGKKVRVFRAKEGRQKATLTDVKLLGNYLVIHLLPACLASSVILLISSSCSYEWLL